MLQELLQGFRKPKAHREIVRHFSALPLLVPDREDHIHAAEIQLIDGDRMDSIWQGWSEGEHQGTMTFHLERTD